MSSTDPSETVPADVRALAEKFEDNHIHVHGVASLRNTIEQAILADRKARALSEGEAVAAGTRLKMRANVYRDPFSGTLAWFCTEEGSKEDGHDEEAVTLAANTFAIGTLLQIWEPDND